MNNELQYALINLHNSVLDTNRMYTDWKEDERAREEIAKHTYD